MSGTEATSPPKIELRFAISVAAIIKAKVVIVLRA
jgi:hypothetical protein